MLELPIESQMEGLGSLSMEELWLPTPLKAFLYLKSNNHPIENSAPSSCCWVPQCFYFGLFVIFSYSHPELEGQSGPENCAFEEHLK